MENTELIYCIQCSHLTATDMPFKQYFCANESAPIRKAMFDDFQFFGCNLGCRKENAMDNQERFLKFMQTEHLCKTCRFHILTCEAREGDLHYGLEDNYINDNIIDCKYYKTREGNKNDK